MNKTESLAVGILIGVLVGIPLGWMIAQVIGSVPASVVFERDSSGRITAIHYARVR